MKTVLCFLVLVVVAFARPDSSTYTDKYDNINIDEILSNKRLLTPYIKCMLDEIKCSTEGKELKSHIKDALENECIKCTDAQKSGTRKVIGHLINKEPEYWSQLTKKYDPKQHYSQKYEKEL
ncbi:A10/OS-D family protein, partial [Bacillus amyloliquefaciens]|uniref:A10/OS-D family protein n=1 Tax=Bacillus amyloliquefaciens TaxID=1390 RepID=UPI002119CA45